MTPLQRFVQYVIICGVTINAANFTIAFDRYIREIEQSGPQVSQSCLFDAAAKQ
jgi:hypothetical protein